MQEQILSGKYVRILRIAMIDIDKLPSHFLCAPYAGLGSKTMVDFPHMIDICVVLCLWHCEKSTYVFRKHDFIWSGYLLSDIGSAQRTQSSFQCLSSISASFCYMK